MLLKGLPVWVEKLVLKALKDWASPADVAEAIASAKAFVIEQLRTLAAKTETKFDDNVVNMVEQALSSCSDELGFLCDLIARGEVALVELLRGVAAKTPTIIDDWAVDLLAEALGAKKTAVAVTVTVAPVEPQV